MIEHIKVHETYVYSIQYKNLSLEAVSYPSPAE